MRPVVAPQQDGAIRVAHRTAEIDGLSVFYREAGEPASPKLLLLGGFPASSHQFRNLIPALADRFHVLSPDYPGFGNTDMPDDFEYTFERLAEIVEGVLEQTDFHPFGVYMHDYGGPIGNRIVTRHPSWLEWQVIQNANAYEEGFTAVWDGIRALWLDRRPDTEAPLASFLELDGVKLLYLHGHRDPERISPDNWNMDLHFLERPGARRAQLDLLYDYRTNVELYPRWQAFLREHMPPTLILWAENDIIFAPEGARAYLRHLPEAELHMLDSGHFALEDSLEVIAAHIKRFHAEQVVGLGGATAVEPEASAR
jgi:pimeloyl-ACP methyl ester carboxylesterase